MRRRSLALGALVLGSVGCSSLFTANAGAATTIWDGGVQPSGVIEAQAAVGAEVADDVQALVGVAGRGSFGRVVEGGVAPELHVVATSDEHPVFDGSIGFYVAGGRDLVDDVDVFSFGAALRGGPVIDLGEPESASSGAYLLPRLLLDVGGRSREDVVDVHGEPVVDTTVTFGLELGGFLFGPFLECPHC